VHKCPLYFYTDYKPNNWSGNRNFHSTAFLGKVRKEDINIEVLSAVTMKKFIFWNITPLTKVNVSRRFGGTHRLHLQGRKASQENKQQEANAS
jgi:hypothetical protein